MSGPSLRGVLPMLPTDSGIYSRVIAMPAEERAVWWHEAAVEEIAELFHAIGATQWVALKYLLPELNTAVVDRWLSLGSNAFEVAMRAHPAESDEVREAIAAIAPHAEAMMPVAAWRADLQRRHQEADDAEAAAKRAEANARASVTAMVNETNAVITHLAERFGKPVVELSLKRYRDLHATARADGVTGGA